jgi:hypothetical protein
MALSADGLDFRRVLDLVGQDARRRAAGVSHSQVTWRADICPTVLPSAGEIANATDTRSNRMQD